MAKVNFEEKVKVATLEGVDVVISNSTLETAHREELQEYEPYVVILVPFEQGWFDLNLSPENALMVADALRYHAFEVLVEARAEQLRAS